MLVVGIILGVSMLIGLCMVLYEAKHAVQVNPNEPFIYGDYDYRKDPTLKHQRVFCENCQFFDGTNICLAEPMSEVTDARVSHCKATSMFVAK